MKDFRDRSKEYIVNEFKECFHDFYVTVLDRAEKLLTPDKRSKSWEAFRFEILNIGNSYVREVDKIMDNYVIEFRPAIFSVTYSNAETNKKVQASCVASFQFEFGKDYTINPPNAVEIPYMCITLPKSDEAFDTLEDIQVLLNCGAVYETVDNKVRLEVKGLYDVFHRVIPCFTTYSVFKGKILEQFTEWKEKVYLMEAGNVKKAN